MHIVHASKKNLQDFERTNLYSIMENQLRIGEALIECLTDVTRRGIEGHVSKIENNK